MFITLGLIAALSFWQSYQAPQAMFRLLYRQGFWLLGAGLILSSTFAAYPGEAYLQLLNYLPFFWFWAALVLHLRSSPHPWQQILRWALALVFTSVVLNLVGIVEFALKHSAPDELLYALPWIDWVYTGNLHHPRAFSFFHYPNTLASYLVMILGLNLGLLQLQQTETFGRLAYRLKLLLLINVPLTLGCLYASGSRNGFLTAAVLMVISLIGWRVQRWVRLLGFATLAMTVAVVLQFGIGGRSVSWAWITDDPRVGVWQLALEMMSDRPWLGYGLGNYKLLYDGQVPGYDFIAHAHNLWLMLGAETGIPVMLGFSVVIGLICYRGLQGWRSLWHAPNCSALLGSFALCFLGIMMYSLLDVTLFEFRVNFLGWLALVVLYLAPELSREVPPN
jgi:O-antigen ligase